jgi:prophage regulatory protein
MNSITHITKTPRLIRLPEVLSRVGVSRSTLYTMIQRGEFPASRKLSPRIAVWSDAEVSQWVASRLAEAA